MIRKPGLIVAFLSLFAIAFHSGAFAAAGSLDPTFGNRGKVLTSLHNCGTAICIADPIGAFLQPDGNIVVGVRSAASVLRYLNNGSLDPNFGSNGVALVPKALGAEAAIILQEDGKIVVAGENAVTNGTAVTVARLNSNGTLDANFGSDGIAAATLNGAGRGLGEAVLIQPDNAILVAATVSKPIRPVTSVTALARFNPNGSPDTSFGNGGAEIITGATSGVRTTAVLQDGEILVVNGSAIAQFTSNGTLEPNVTGGTIVATSNNEVFLSNGNFLHATTVSTGSLSSEAQVLEFTHTGAKDSAFNNPMFGFVSDGFNQGDSTGLQADGKIVVGGARFAPDSSSSVDGLARLNTDGSMDSSFGNDGTLTTSFTNHDLGYDFILIQNDGSIVAIGASEDRANLEQDDVALARYLAE
ncbi:MAG: hypothetical protein JO189_27480 [Deltaproteobacteria bacterium]|nr:hypothetical protein [Deltaproteobacteria bacterium]